MDGEVYRQCRARSRESAERFLGWHRRGAPRHTRQHQALRDPRDRQFAAEAGGSCREGGHAGGQRVGNPVLLQPTHLLGNRAPHREIAGMQPRHILPGCMRGHIFALDFV